MSVKEVVISAINPIQHRTQSQYGRVKISWRTPRTEPLYKRQTKYGDIRNVHEYEIHVGSLFQGRSIVSVKISNEIVEPKEVEEIRKKDQQEKAEDVFGGCLKNEDANQLRRS